MTSLPAAVARASMLGVKHGVSRLPLGTQRAVLAGLGRANLSPRGTRVTEVRLGERAALRVEAPGASADGAVLWLHGGAFITMVPRSFVPSAAHVSRASGLPVFVLDQRLAPEHPHPADVEDAVAAFDALGVPTSLVGDSAGGTTALLTALALRDRGTPAHALGLVSPLVDLTLERSGAYEGREYVIRRGWSELGVSSYLAGQDGAAVSPLERDLTGLPPTAVQWSEHEVLAPEAVELVSRLRAAGVETTTRYLPGMFHEVQLYPGLVPEAAEALADLGRRLR